ncbi:hypothetical protein ACRQDV_07020 [Actinotignum sp. GS-2025e]|uniref:hypothetical protein n=1 Tax=Actinotignum sp. GS-2025e TaxID=3427278 RepID=UPI003F45F193
MDEQPIQSIPSDLTPSPPAKPQTEDSKTPQPASSSLDLAEPILEVLTSPNV